MAKCEKCGYRKRGPKHEEGTHHKEGENGHKQGKKV